MFLPLPVVNRAEILQYLGWRGSEIPPEVEQQLADAVETVRRLAKPRFIYRPFAIEWEEHWLRLAGSDIVLPGQDIRELLAQCDRCVLMAATLGGEVEREMRQAAVRDMTRSVLLDAVCSAAIEAVCDAADEMLANEYGYLTDRFSPGYGDLPLDMQRDFVALLDTPRGIGLTLTDSLILTPRKSVTAIIGIADTPQTKRFRGCAYCGMFENCSFRKAGKTCGKV